MDAPLSNFHRNKWGSASDAVMCIQFSLIHNAPFKHDIPQCYCVTHDPDIFTVLSCVDFKNLCRTLHHEHIVILSSKF